MKFQIQIKQQNTLIITCQLEVLYTIKVVYFICGLLMIQL